MASKHIARKVKKKIVVRRAHSVLKKPSRIITLAKAKIAAKKAGNKSAACAKKNNPNNSAIQQSAPKEMRAQESPVARIEREYNELKQLLVQKRKTGMDTFVEELKLFTIPPKIQLLKVQMYEKDLQKAKDLLSDVRAYLESGVPKSTPLDKLDLSEKKKEPSEILPVVEDANNYARELKAKPSVSNIANQISEIFKKRGGK